METIFSEFSPELRLQPYIQSYWSGIFNTNSLENYSQSVVPNGCIELIIHLTNDHCALSKSFKGWSYSPSFTLLGVFDNVYEVRFNSKVEVFGIRFFPDGIKNVFGVPPSEFHATYEDGIDVLGSDLKDFCEQIRESREHSQRVAMANAFISKQLERNRSAFDYSHLTMELIRQNHGKADYNEIVEKIPISPRQLQREFKRTYGLTVTEYMRLTRMNAIHNYMISNGGSLTELSHEMNFTDQSHFIKEFKNYSGITPKRFSKSRERFIINPIIVK